VIPRTSEVIEGFPAQHIAYRSFNSKFQLVQNQSCGPHANTNGNEKAKAE